VEDEPVVARGRVILPSGLALDGLSVALHSTSGDELASADADDKGLYEVRCGTSLLAGWTLSTTWIGISPAATGFTGKTIAPAFQRVDRAHPYGAPPLDCDLVLGEAPKFEGVVTESATGKPIEGAMVSVFSSLPAWRDYPLEEAMTDAEGKYQLELETFPAQQLFVCCKADEFQALIQGPLDAALGASATVNFALGPGVKISGRVIDEATMAPIAQASVSVAPIDYPLLIDRLRDATGEDGRFEFEAYEMDVNRCTLRVDAKGYAPVVLSTQKTRGDVEIKLGKPAVLTGVVREKDGSPVSGARIDVSLADEWTWNDANFTEGVKTNGEGKFRLTLELIPADDAVISIDYHPFRPYQAAVKAIQTKASNATTREVEIVLEREGSGTAKK
jgi:hypothetical protein